MSFPSFDGENPRLWKDRCELYFEIYSVHDALKPRFAALNFKGAAAAWLQTFELRGRVDTWERLYTAVCDRFDRNQYQLVMRQLDNLRQTSSVQEYHIRFEQLAHQLLLYNAQYDDVYFVTRFMGGLKEEICAPCRMDLPGPTTSVGTRTDYSVGPWDYPACATRHLMACSTRTTEEKYSVRKLYISRTVWKTPRRTRLVLSPYSDL
jgi:hypothetical protein